MKVDCKRSIYSSSKKTSKKDQTKKGDKSKDDTDIVEVPVTDKANAASVENSTAVTVCVLNVNYYYPTVFYENRAGR